MASLHCRVGPVVPRPSDPSFVVLFVLIQIVIIPYQFVQGSKTFLSLLPVSIVIAHCWTRGRLPKLLVPATVAFVALFVFPFVQDFRTFVNITYGAIPSLKTLDIQAVRHRFKHRRLQPDVSKRPSGHRFADTQESMNCLV